MSKIKLPRIVEPGELRAGDIFVWKLKNDEDFRETDRNLVINPYLRNTNQCFNLSSNNKSYIFDDSSFTARDVVFKLISRDNFDLLEKFGLQEKLDKTPEITNNESSQTPIYNNNMNKTPPDMTREYQYYVFEPNSIVHAAIRVYLENLGFGECDLEPQYKQITISFKNNRISGNSVEENKPCFGQKIDLNFLFSQEFRDLYEKSKVKKQTIKLNNSYSAEVVQGQDFVTVGCQQIPIINIRELVAVIDDVNG